MQIFLETERMVLRQFAEADLDNLVELDSDPEVMRFLTSGTPTPREVIQNKILPAFLHSYARFPGFGVWVAIEKASGNFMGWFSLQAKDAGNPNNAELGYRLRRAFWNQGYATEGASALIHKAFMELSIQCVFATTYEDNLASRRVMEKAGLRLIRRYRMTLEDLLAAGTFQVTSDDLWEGDDVEYALLKTAWKQQDRFS